ncbi:MAG TPA: hypothetical protein VL172_00115 [Kofleriaceae bacterium]|nr:hypothetical protein [Kofleriaceae bacterium]
MKRPSREKTPPDAVPRRGSRPSRTTAERVVAAAKGLPPAQPGARSAAADSGQPSDFSVTARIERMPSEVTPEPLPPSPADQDAGVWFDQVPTNPAAVPDLESMAGSRSDLAAAVARHGTGQPHGRDAWTPPSALYAAARIPLARRPWVMPLLIAATALTIGMVLGALLFGASHSSSKTPCEKTSPPADHRGP